MTISRKSVATAVALLAALGLVAAACGDDGAAEATKQNETINAIYIMDGAGLHGLDESINDQRTVPANAANTYRRLQAVALLTEWPTSELEEKAETLAGVFEQAAASVDTDNPDLAKAGPLASQAHDGEHDFSAEVWEYLLREAGVAGAGEAHD
jgi:hypothetical protein